MMCVTEATSTISATGSPPVQAVLKIVSAGGRVGGGWADGRMGGWGSGRQAAGKSQPQSARPHMPGQVSAKSPCRPHCHFKAMTNATTTAPPPPAREPPAAPPPPAGEAPEALEALPEAPPEAPPPPAANWQIAPVDPQPLAANNLQIVPVTGVPGFRIGSRRNGFVYTLSRWAFLGNPVYQCTRGSGISPLDVYWLYRCAAGHWLCAEAFSESADPIRDGVPQFKTVGHNIDDISVECDALAWQHWDEHSAQWSQRSMTFPTAHVWA